jgi:hypothetical protein
MDHELHRHRQWPYISGVRLQGKCETPYFIYGVDLAKSYGRFDQNIPELLYVRFRAACISYEQLHGERAANDFRLTNAEPAIHDRDAARAGSSGGKERDERIQPCVAPSVANARIGANSL